MAALESPIEPKPSLLAAIKKHAVLKVYATHCKPDFGLPWTRTQELSSSSSAFVMTLPTETGKLLPAVDSTGRKPRRHARRFIITNAHSVADSTSVRLRKYGQSVKYAATVRAVCHTCDLALLEVRNDRFWEGMDDVLELALTPRLQERVLCVGYPMAGDNLCFTGGVVSRIDYIQYAHSGANLSAIQIDAAINSGASGGACLSDGKVVGVSFQAWDTSEAEAIGHIIPADIVRFFLTDVAMHGSQVKGFGRLGLSYQCLENTALRQHVGMKPSDTGVLITHVNPTVAVGQALKQHDVLLAIDDVSIADDGTVPYGESRLPFGHEVAMHHPGDTIVAHIIRGGKRLAVDVCLQPMTPLVPGMLHDKEPKYLLWGGLVFTQLSMAYLEAQYGSKWDTVAPIRNVYDATARRSKLPGEEIILLSHVLAHPANIGYEVNDFATRSVKAVNGVPVRNLAEMCRMLFPEGPPDARRVHDVTADELPKCPGAADASCVIVLEENIMLAMQMKQAWGATMDLMRSHKIHSAVSEQLLGTPPGALGVTSAPRTPVAPKDSAGPARKTTHGNPQPVPNLPEDSSAATPGLASSPPLRSASKRPSRRARRAASKRSTEKRTSEAAAASADDGAAE